MGKIMDIINTLPFLVGWLSGGVLFGTIAYCIGFMRGHFEGGRDALDEFLDIDRKYPGRGMIDP